MPKRIGLEDFLRQSRISHGDRYDYSNVNVQGSKSKVEILCVQHGVFYQAASEHMYGKGCAKCSGNTPVSYDEFVMRARDIHGEKYTYNIDTYFNVTTKTEITCPEHGLFFQKPNNHVAQKQGCGKCGKTAKIVFDDFVEMAYEVHGERYLYDQSAYKSFAQKTTVICAEHGEFYPEAVAHVRKKTGCPKCSNNISKMELEYLDSIGLPNTPEFRQVVIPLHEGLARRKSVRVDGYDPVTKTVYEFNGDFWHGNPNIYGTNDVNPRTKKTYGYHYGRTLEKQKLLEQHGYTVISIWESDWMHINRSSGLTNGENGLKAQFA